WDVTGWVENPPFAAPLPLSERRKLSWSVLGADDAKKAHRMIWTLVAAPKDSLAILKERLRPVPLLDPQWMAQRIADLDSDQYVVREKATAELRKLGERAEPSIRKALRNKPSLEMSRRLAQLLNDLQELERSRERRQLLRAIEVLEQIGNGDA